MILGQDYELIFINDGSTDRSLEILNSYTDLCKKGCLIINQQNSGVSSARNEGLKHAQGKYVWFVDSDDIIAPQSLEWAESELKKNPQLKVLRYYNRRIPELVDAYELLRKQYTPVLPQTATAFSLIVNREYLMANNIIFNKSMAYGEDTLWVFEVNFLAEDEYICDGGHVNYFYRIRNGSAMQTRNAESKQKHLTSMETMLMEYEKILAEKRNHLTATQKNHLLKRIDWSVQNVLFDSLMVLPKDERQSVFNRVAHRQKSINWGRLSPGYGLKNLLLNLLGLPLKYKSYYALMGWLFSLVKR